MSPQRPSERRVAKAILPPTHSDVEFELAILHGVAYPSLVPLDISSISLTGLADHGLTREVTPAVAPPSPVDAPRADGDDQGALVALLPSLRDTPATSPPVSGPSRPKTYCDARLNDLQLRFWTKVPISADLAASAISKYLETDHAITGPFDADLFLSDLANHRLEHCSALLVSAYLCIACVGDVA